jgi:hypothetical protein
MQQAEFELLLLVDVKERAAVERTPPEGKPKYYVGALKELFG